jgi:exodeoxyribonuclease-3
VPKKTRLTVATVNVNGIRAAVTNGMEGWVAERQPDVVTMQEVRAPDAMVGDLVRQITGPKWSVVHDECEFKGRAGVAVAAKKPIAASRAGLKVHTKKSASAYNDTGRWIEADLDTPDGKGLTVISAYVHTGDAEQPDKMKEKLAFMWAAKDRLKALLASKRHVLLTGDLNVAHKEVDLKNWKGNLKSAGFLPEERVWFDELFDDLGLVDVARRLSGDGPGPYSWWSWRGKAFDTDAGWRIDYHIASPGLADVAVDTAVDRAPSYAERWSDHAPVVVTYAL